MVHKASVRFQVEEERGRFRLSVLASVMKVLSVSNFGNLPCRADTNHAWLTHSLVTLFFCCCLLTCKVDETTNPSRAALFKQTREISETQDAHWNKTLKCTLLQQGAQSSVSSWPDQQQLADQLTVPWDCDPHIFLSYTGRKWTHAIFKHLHCQASWRRDPTKASSHLKIAFTAKQESPQNYTFMLFHFTALFFTKTG